MSSIQTAYLLHRLLCCYCDDVDGFVDLLLHTHTHTCTIAHTQLTTQTHAQKYFHQLSRMLCMKYIQSSSVFVV